MTSVNASAHQKPVSQKFKRQHNQIVAYIKTKATIMPGIQRLSGTMPINHCTKPNKGSAAARIPAVFAAL